jgi:hypothetical protein
MPQKGDPSVKGSENYSAVFRERLTHLKQAQSYAAKGDIPHAVERYKKYLQCLAAFHKTTEDKLDPKMFDPTKDLTELFLISHTYWDLAKAYDRAPKFQKEAKRYLDQFVKFTIGHKFQHANYRMLRKFMKKKLAHHPEHFKEAHTKLKVESKGCYIATHCFGHDSPITNHYRGLKPLLLRTAPGACFVDLYYDFSPSVVSFLSKHPVVNFIITKLFFRPLLFLLYGMTKS